MALFARVSGKHEVDGARDTTEKGAEKRPPLRACLVPARKTRKNSACSAADYDYKCDDHMFLLNLYSSSSYQLHSFLTTIIKQKYKCLVPPMSLLYFIHFIYLYANDFFILYVCFYIYISYFHLWQACSFSADGKLLVSASDDQTVVVKHLLLFIFSLFSCSVLLFSLCILSELHGTIDLICKSINITPSEHSVSFLLPSSELFSLILNVPICFFRFACGTLKMESA